MNRTFVASVFTVLQFASSAAGQVPAQAGEIPPPSPAGPAGNYRMQAGDVVDVRFFYNPELNEQGVQIRPDGRIAVHLIGDVTFAGRTVEEVRKELETSYAQSLRYPRITVQLRGYSTQKAYVSGEVMRPGMVSLTSAMNLLAAVSEAGGIKLTGAQNRVVLIRKMPDGTPGSRQVSLFLKGKPTPDALLPLQPFDVVLVPETKIARMDRWVDQHIRSLLPVNMNAGFTYLWQNLSNGGSGTVVAPPF